MDRKWWKEGTVYQIYPRSFADSNGDGVGDLPGIISKLDYLHNLGITIIWLSPVYQSPNDDNGYDISDYQAIMEEFGTVSDWEKLLAELHARGMKLIMDLVVNHSSDEHHWFVESRKSKDNPYRDYYIWREGEGNHAEPNNWESCFSGSAWQYDAATDEYFLHLFSKKQPDLNWENPKVRQEIYDMMTWWLDKGIDGFRMDVINMISKVEGLPSSPAEEGRKYVSGGAYFMNGPRIHDYLREMNEKVLSRYDIMTVGETPGVTPEQAMDYVHESRQELNMLFQFELMDIDSGNGKWDVRPYKLTDLKRILSKWQYGLGHGKGWNSLYMNNHDQPRMVSRFGDDQMYRVESAKMLGTLLHTQQGTPYVYQGEEIGMTNVQFDSIDEYRDIETLNMYNEKVHEQGADPAEVMKTIYIKGRDNARTPMQWEDAPHAGFTTGTPWLQVNPNYREINAKQAVADPNSIYNYYKRLIQTRKHNLVLIYGEFEELLQDSEQFYVYTRTLGEERALIVLNFTNQAHTFSLPTDVTYDRAELLISNYEVENAQEVRLYTARPYEARVYRLL